MYPFKEDWEPRVALVTLADGTQHIAKIIYGDTDTFRLRPYDLKKKDFCNFFLTYPARAVYQVMEDDGNGTEDGFLKLLLEMQESAATRAKLTAGANAGMGRPLIERGN